MSSSINNDDLFLQSINHEIITEVDNKSINNKSIQGGYFTPHSDQKKVFENFLEHSTIELLTPLNSSCFGIIFKCTLTSPDIIPEPNMNYWRLNTRTILQPPRELSPIEDSWTPSEYMEKVTTICIKMAFVCESDVKLRFDSSMPLTHTNSDPNPHKYTKYTVKIKEILEEAITQNAIVKKTNNHFEPVCPYILFFANYKEAEKTSIFTKLREAAIEVLKPDIDYIVTSLNGKQTVSMAFLVMENLQDNRNTQTLNIYKKNIRENIKTIKQKTRREDRAAAIEMIHNYNQLYNNTKYMIAHEIIRCAEDARVINLDLHYRNMLFVPEYPYYDIDGTSGRLQLIDFGQILTIDEANKHICIKHEYVDDNGDTKINYAYILLKIAIFCNERISRMPNTCLTIIDIFKPLLKEDMEDDMASEELEKIRTNEGFLQYMKKIYIGDPTYILSIPLVGEFNHKLNELIQKREDVIQQIKSLPKVDELYDQIKVINQTYLSNAAETYKHISATKENKPKSSWFNWLLCKSSSSDVFTPEPAPEPAPEPISNKAGKPTRKRKSKSTKRRRRKTKRKHYTR